MKWTKDQKQKILDSFWKNGISYCPIDGIKLTIKSQPEVGRGNNIIFVSCPRCSEFFDSDELTPAIRAFDDYTDDEKTTIANSYFATKKPVCPKDGILLDISRTEDTGGWNLMIRCPRCGRLYNWDNSMDNKLRSRKNT